MSESKNVHLVNVPREWLARVTEVLREFAVEGMFIPGYREPEELMVELAKHFGTTNAANPWRAIISGLQDGEIK